MIHTNAIAYGFLANAFLGMLHWAVPRLTLKPVFDRRLSYAIFFAWQVVVIATAVGILLGEAQGLEWGETPVWIDPIALAGLLLVAINFGAPIARTTGPLYVTLWYFLAAFVWTFLTYAMGNFIPQYFVSGTSAGAVGGLFIHDLVGLFVTPLGWGMVYYFVPIMLKKPIWSHGLSLVGFWGLAFFYPLTGIHHFLYTPIPMFLQYGAIISTIAVELVVTTVIINFFATIRGSTQALVTNLPIRWLYTGMVFYFLTCLQCAFQTTLTFQALIHFTDWVVGHAHMVMFGVFAMWLLGVMTYLIPRLLKTPWYSQQLLEWHYWLSAMGILVMSADLIVLGVFQGLVVVFAHAVGRVDRILDPLLGRAAGGGAVHVCRAHRVRLQHRRDVGVGSRGPARAGCQCLKLRGFSFHAGNQNRRILHRGARLFRTGVSVERAVADHDVSPSARADRRAVAREERQPALSVRRPGPAVSGQLHRGLRPPPGGRGRARETG